MANTDFEVQVEKPEEVMWEKQSIYKIPVSLTHWKPREYHPQMVSIGPYHDGEENLKKMEVHKRRALTRFLKRSKKTIEDLRQVLYPMLQDLRDAYNELDTKWQDAELFLDLMIMDGCFILELLRTTTVVATKDMGGPTKDAGGPTSSCHNDYVHNDPIFSNHGWLNIVPYLRRDILMLENQIPMLVLEELYSVKPFQEGNDGLIKCALYFLIPGKDYQKPEELKDSKHILDLHRRNLIGKRKTSTNAGTSDQLQRDEIIRSATELRNSGISIKCSKTKRLTDITFKQCGLSAALCLPLIVVDDAFESVYLNMMAYERFHIGAGSEVTSYIFFMDNIIDSVEDVVFLHRGGVIQNALGSEEAAAKLFNSLSRDCTLDPNSKLAVVHCEVSQFCKKPWNQWKAYCYHNYCTNPWVAISVVAAIFIFAITIVSTVYTVLGYVKPRPSSR